MHENPAVSHWLSTLLVEKAVPAKPTMLLWLLVAADRTDLGPDISWRQDADVHVPQGDAEVVLRAHAHQALQQYAGHAHCT